MRRTRLLSFLSAVGLSLCLTAEASAQTFDAWSNSDLEERKASESPQNAAVELRVGPYVPKVDGGLSFADTSFDSAFGDKKRIAVALEVDWQVLRIPYFGSLGPGFSVGYTRMKAFLPTNANADANADTSADANTDATADKTPKEVRLTIFPMYVVAVLRIDGIARHTPVPLVPYGKFGIGYAAWSAKQWEGNPSVANDAKSPSAGFQGALGIMLMLDPFDRGADVIMDTNLGVNASYFFLEWYNSTLDGFGSGDDLDVGTNTWVLGLTLEI